MSLLNDVGPFLALTLVVSALGFVRLVYFVSLGYAFSILGQAVLLVVLRGGALPALGWAHVVLLGLYGLRLGWHLTAREREPSFRRELEEIQARTAHVGRGKQVLIWIGVAVLYVLMFSPALFNAWAGEPAVGVLTAVGVAVQVAGLGLEALADAQKASFKRSHPSAFCDVKLYRVVRCPNYLGELIFWLGSLLAGVGALQHWAQWLAALTGFVCIFLIMLGSTKRLEHKQDVRYGALPEYQRYVRTVPVLFPWVPVYSLKGVRVYLE